MAELLKTKTEVRGGHRAHTSKVIDQCKQLLENFEPAWPENEIKNTEGHTFRKGANLEKSG